MKDFIVILFVIVSLVIGYNMYNAIDTMMDNRNAAIERTLQQL